MSASPEHALGSPAASPDRAEENVATPNAGDDNQEKAEASGDDDDDEGGISDDESILSEVDEAQFENFDPENVDVEDRPQLAIDEDNLKLIGRHKRKREEGESRPRRKEGRREKKRRGQDDEDGDEASSRRKEKKKKEKKPAEPDTDEETLDPETRRRRALDRAMDEAMKKPTKRRARKQDGIVCRYWVATGLYTVTNTDS
jgi:transcription factor SPN1